jgi:membrane protein implicated in regulation of membrane protease activity
LSARERTAAVFARYWLYQLPGIFVAGLVLTLLVEKELISTRVAALLMGLWLLKELILFPITRVGYERGGRPHGADALAGRVGVLQGDIAGDETGWVRLGPELWRVRLESGQGPLAAGAQVRVVRVEGLVLRVSAEAP